MDERVEIRETNIINRRRALLSARWSERKKKIEHVQLVVCLSLSINYIIMLSHNVSSIIIRG